MADFDSVSEYETRWYTTGYDVVSQPNGSQNTYYWVEMAPAVIVVATTETDLVLVEQYRPVVGRLMIECSAGVIEHGESITEAGARELEEETEDRARSVELLQTYNPSPAVLRQEWSIVHATELALGETRRDENEFLDGQTVPLEKATTVVREDSANGATLAALFVAADESIV